MLLRAKSMLRKLPAIGIAAIARLLDSSFIRLLLPPAKNNTYRSHATSPALIQSLTACRALRPDNPPESSSPVIAVFFPIFTSGGINRLLSNRLPGQMHRQQALPCSGLPLPRQAAHRSPITACSAIIALSITQLLLRSPHSCMIIESRIALHPSRS